MQQTYWDMLLDEILNKKSQRLFTTPHKTKPKPKNRRKLKMYSLGKKFKDICFSKREAECMIHLLRGKTVKQTAQKIGLSQRTVEYYLKNIKKKVGCRTKIELIELVLGSSFLQNYHP
jgi:DNA-binding CsgD family transcriptional regulator